MELGKKLSLLNKMLGVSVTQPQIMFCKFKLRSCSRLSLEITSDAAQRGKPHSDIRRAGFEKGGNP